MTEELRKFSTNNADYKLKKEEHIFDKQKIERKLFWIYKSRTMQRQE